MQEYQIIKMKDYSNDQIDRIRSLEQICKINDRSTLRVGIDSLKAVGGDEAYLCLCGNRLIGFFSWYTSDGTEANINGMVFDESKTIPGRRIKALVLHLKISGRSRFRIYDYLFFTSLWRFGDLD
ncbi:hypothetical protein [Paenibacillus woosongensis]|uniref:hypothetical protein n=1 Tax=Paenibacillus woosongensis TaxID=307580 RepID=UPI001E2ACF8C|nr:hypothetical protein [Paenibacillus woosongensis]